MYFSSRQSGFTLIEMLVSLSLFTVIITITVGSLLVLVNSNRELASSQSLMDTVAFSLDSMTREIRTGRAYFCGSVNNKNAAASGYHMFREGGGPPNRHEEISNNVNPCPTGRGNFRIHGVSIIEADDSITGTGSNRILYYYEASPSSAPDTPGRLMRRIGNNPAESILSSSINVTDADFFVTGTDRLVSGSDNTEQPTVTVLIEAVAIDNPADIITLQTTVTQRELDI